MSKKEGMSRRQFVASAVSAAAVLHSRANICSTHVGLDAM